MKAGSIQVLTAYLIIFAPLLLFMFWNEGLYFLVYGACIALLNTAACLAQTIREDLEQRRAEKAKGKRYG